MNVIYIHGALPIKLPNPRLQSAVMKAYSWFDFTPQFHDSNPWIEFFDSHFDDFHYFSWDGNISPWHVHRTSKRLEAFLDPRNHDYANTVFVTESFGTHLLLKHFYRNSIKNQRIIGITPVFKKSFVRGLDHTITLFESSSDTFANVANTILWPSNNIKAQSSTGIISHKLDLLHHQFTPNFQFASKTTVGAVILQATVGS